MAVSLETLNQLDSDRSYIRQQMSSFSVDNRFSWRVKTILDRNPYMASNMNAVLDLAKMPISDNEVFANAGAAYGMQATDVLAKQMSRYTPSVQRAIFVNLTAAQQSALTQMGYTPDPASVFEDGFFDQVFDRAMGVAGAGLSVVSKGFGNIVMPVVSPALNLLDEASDFVVGRPYRTIRQLSSEGQIAALLGGTAAVIGVLAAVPTGGTSLALTGLAGVAGATAASALQQTFVGNADDWANAWSQAGNGEKLFKPGGIRKATEILGDPKLVSVAQKLALALDEDLSLIEVAQQVAGIEGSLDPSRQQKQIAEIAADFATENTPEYQTVYKGLTNLLNDPLFQDAVTVLEQSKISIGRDVAGMFGLDPDSDGYRIISGAVDAASLLILDPFLVAGKAARIVNQKRRGLEFLDASAAASRFRELSKLPEINRAYEVFAEAVNTGSAQLVKRYVPWLMPVWNDVLIHSKNPELADRLFSADDFVDWVVGSNQMKSLMQGVGVVQGVSYGALKGLNRFQYAMRTGRGNLSDFMIGASDVAVEKLLPKLGENPQALEELLKTVPEELHAQLAFVGADEVPELLSTLVRKESGIGTTAYQAGRKLAQSRVPGIKTLGTFYENITTLSPRGTLIAIDILDRDSVGDINAFIDMFKVAGVPSYVREIWKKAIYESPEVGTRLNSLASMIDTMATASGIRSTLSGADMMDNLLLRFKQHYALGKTGRFTLRRSGGMDDIDDIPIAVLPEADTATLMQIPDLKAMRQAVKQGTFLRVLAGVSDNTVIDSFQNRFWKPSVLLRFGFVVRNATEDVLAFITRTGMGSLTQEFAARSIAQENIYVEALQKTKPVGVGNINRGEGFDAVLSHPERWALTRNFDVPAHARPLVRIIERFGSTASPGITFLSEYGVYLRDRLRNGFAPFQKIGNVVMAPIRAGAEKAAPGSAYSNFYSNLSLLAAGSPTSIRRLLAGGANGDLVRAAEDFHRTYFPSIMQRVGASSHLPWQTPNDGDQIVVRTISQADGRKAPQQLRVRVKGERTLTTRNVNDAMIEDFHESILKEITRLTDDGPASRILLEISKVLSPDIEAALPLPELQKLLALWNQTERRTMGGSMDNVLRLGLLLNEPNLRYERYQAFINNINDFGFYNVGPDGVEDVLLTTLKQRFAGNTVPTSEEFRNIWRELLNKMRRENKEGVANLLSSATPTMNFVAALETVSTPSAKKWLLSNLYLDSATMGQHFSGPSGLSLTDILANWRNSNGAEIPFYRSLEDAKTAGKNFLIDEINEGQWDYVFSLNRDYIPGAPGSKFYVLKTGETFNSVADIRGGLYTKNLVDRDGLPIYGEFAKRLKVDFDFLNRKQQEVFQRFIDDFIYSLKRSDSPFFVGDKAVADALHGIVNELHQIHKLVPPKVATSWLPVTETQKLVDVYPDLVGRVAERTDRIDSGLSTNSMVSGLMWDSTIYPTPDASVEALRAQTYPNNIVERLLDDIDQNIRGGRRTKVVLKDNVTLYMNLNGSPVEIPPGTVVDEWMDLYSNPELTEKVAPGNLQYTKTTDVVYEGNSDVMWSILAPVMIDYAEDLGGSTIKAVKNSKKVRASSLYKKAGYKEGEIVNLPEDVIRERASNVRDVAETPAELLPDWVLAQTFEPQFADGLGGSWNRFVNYGFNQVFSPILDAIGRRPMAFHSFLNAHTRNMNSVSWLFRGTSEEAELSTVMSSMLKESKFENLPETLLPRYVEAGRSIAELHSVNEFIYWSDEQVLAYLRSLTPEEIATLPQQFNQAISTGRMSINKNKANALSKFVANTHDQLKTMHFNMEATPWNFLDRIEGQIGELTPTSLNPGQLPGFSRAFTQDEWRIVQNAAGSRERAYAQAKEYAAEYAIRDIMPFIDTHEVRSQFADWARGYLPFWYAEENFLKRWARIFTLDGPAGSLARARKLQLAANGLRTMGIVREDPNGDSYFVYPGSDLLIETVSKVFPGINLLPVSAMLQTPTERMIPGFNPNFGQAGYSPLIGLPVEIATFLFPESSAIQNFQRNLMGDISVNQNLLNLIVPAQVSNTFKAIYEYSQPFESTGNERLQSAMFAAIAHLDAAGKGLPDDASAEQRDEFLRKVRNHARVIILSQAIAGWFTPGPAQALQVPDDQDSLKFLTGGQVNNPAEIMSSTYFELIKNLGIEEGTIAYLEKYENNTINDVLSPLAYTVSRTETVSGAPLPMSEDGIAFYESNKELLDQYTYAGPWLLPQDASRDGERSQYAYDSQMINGLRIKKTPEEFLRELKFREGASIYFAARKQYVDVSSQLKETKQDAELKRVKGLWEMFASYWKATHPVFADELVSSDSRERRQNVIQEMRLLLDDPLAPKASHFAPLGSLMRSFDAFSLERSRLNLNRTALGRTRVELLKKNFEDWVTNFVLENPTVNSFWLTVLRPESGLD